MCNFNSCQSGYESGDHNALYDLLNRMKDAFFEERAAIKKMDEEKLRESGCRISDLFSEMTFYMSRVEDFPQVHLQQAAEMLRQARLVRDENSRLLKNALDRTGSAIKKSNTGMQAARNYNGYEPVKELFIKKNC
jgi:hypothetical protein